MKFGVLVITGADGRRRDLPLDLPSLVVGRADGSSIVIDDLSISRRHARLTVDSGRLLVEDLGSAQGTFINGARIAANVPNLVEDDATVRFGDIEVRYEPPPPTETQVQQAAGAIPGDPQLDPGEDLSTRSRLGITLVAPNAPVIAGAPWMTTVRVHNRSNVVDRVAVSVPDLPADWVRLERAELALPPGASETIQLTIIPPRKAESLAGDYDFTVQVRSQEYQREAAALATFTLAPFENLALGFEAPRSKRDFVVVAENRGNQAATYTLEGEDPDAANRYEFELPAILLQPGEQRRVGLRVHHKTPLFGIALPLPFNVHAESDRPGGERVSVLGQLATRPVLQKFLAPAMFVAAVGVIALVAVAILLLRSDSVVTSASAESKFAGVHMCDKSSAAQAADRQKQEAAAVPKPASGQALIAGADPGAPYFAQNDPRWGKEEYAKAKDPQFGPDWCGTTIEQCGCAMTSVATTMALFGLVTMPNGSPLTPEAMNTWFNEDATKTNRGWVSRGYIYGDVIWTAANQLSGEMAKARPGTPTIRFASIGTGSDDEIRGQLKLGRPIILAVPGHYIAAIGLDGDSILINDPYYRDRKTLDVYKGKVKSSVLFEPSDDLSAVVFTVPSDVRVKITDKQGRVVGSLATGTAEDAAKGVVNQIPGASYSNRPAWRDPSCVESPPPADAGTNQIILPGSAADYKIEVLDASGKPTSIAIHTYDKQGKSSVQTIDNPGSAVAELSVDPAAGKADVKVIAGAQPTQTTTGGGGGGNPTVAAPATVAPTRVPAPTATPEAVVETSIAIGTIPGDQFVAIQNADGFLVGDQITLSPGKANEEDNRIVGFGSFILETPLKFAHSPGETIKRKPRLPGQGPGSGGALPPPVVIPPLTAPENLVLGCSTVYSVDPHEATLICTLDITGTFTTTRWSANGKLLDEFNNQQLLLLSYPTDGQAAVGVTVCNRTICKSTSASEKIQFPAPGTTTGLSGGTGTASGTGGAAAPAPTPPATGVIVNCSTQFEQGTNPRAVVTCGALFSGPSTSISWSAPGAVPAAGQGKTFTTNVMPNTVKKLRVTATVCNFAVCQTSPNVDVSIGGSKTTAALKSKNVALGATTTFTAIVTGPVPPAGGTIQFRVNTIPVGPSASIFTAGSLGFAQVTLATGFGPLDYTLNPLKTNTADVSVDAIYSGGTNLFGSTSAATVLTLVPPIEDGCDSVNNNLLQEGTGPFRVDENCLIAQTLDLGGGTVIGNVAVTGPGVRQALGGSGSNDVIAVPGSAITVSASATRTVFCPGCIRQVYLGIGENAANSPVTPAVGPQCVYSGGLGELAPGIALNSWTVSAPTVPGLYYIRATSTTAFTCQPQTVGPPDQSVARLLVQASTSTQTTVTLSQPSIGQGETVTATVKVFPTEARGYVQFTDNGVPLPIPGTQLTTSNTATVSFVAGPAGPHVIRAKFLGAPENLANDPNFRYYFTPTALDQQSGATLISTSPSTTTLDPLSPSTITVGGTVNVRVRVTTPSPLVAPEATVNGGTVTLKNNGVPVQTLPVAPAISGGTGSTEGIADFSFIAGDIGVPDAGSITLTATYSGTTYVAPSTSATQPLTITKTTPSIVLGTTSPVSPGLVPNPIVAGDTLVLTATVTGAPFAFPSGGTVEFRRTSAGNELIAVATVSAPPSAIGVAQTSISTRELCPQPPPTTPPAAPAPTLSCISDAGSYGISAKFIARGNLNDSPASTPETLVVTAAPVTVAITAFDASVTAGGSGKIDIRVSPVLGGKVPGLVTGTVSLFDGATPLPNGANLPLVNANPLMSPDGTVSYPLKDLNVGTYSNIRVHYNASTKYAAGDSTPAISVTVNKANTTVVTTIANTSAIAVGDVVRLRALVGGGASGVLNPDPGGTVQFMAGTNPIGGPRPLSAGVASLDWTSGNVSGFPLDTAFTYTDIRAVYSGNANLTAATSPNVTLTLTKRAPTVSISITPATQTIGGSVGFSATISAGAINPDGAYVQFKAGVNNIGSPVLVVGGSASLSGYVTGSFPFDTASSYTDVRAAYDGTNSNVGAASSASATLTLTKAASSATLGAISNVTLANPGSFSVSVTTTSPFPVNGTGGNAQVQFYNGATAIGSPVTVSAGGIATYSPATGSGTDFPASGTFTIHAVYLGTSQLATATTGDVPFTIDPAPTATVLVITGGTLTVGGAGTLTANISPTGSQPGPVTGTVTFSSSQGTLGSAAVTNPSGNNGQAVLNISGLNANSYTNVIATYADASGNYAGSASAAQSFTIQKATPTITLTPPGTYTIGAAVTFTATVGDASSVGVLSPAGGTVTFKAGVNTIGTATVSSGRIASLTFTTGVAPLDTGDSTYSDITASFVDDGPNLNSVTSASGTLVLNKAAATVTLNDNVSVAFGSSITYTATVTASNGNANLGNGVATVTFTIPGGYSQTVTLNGGTAAVTLTAGTTVPLTAVGSYAITAAYNGSSQVATGAGTDSFAVVKATPTVTVTANSGSVGIGSSVTITATVTAGASPDGATVRFSVGGTQIGADQTLAGGTAAVTFTTGTAPMATAGTYTVVADYRGNSQVLADNTQSTSVTVTKASPTVTFNAPPSTTSATLGASLTFEVNVTGSGSKSPAGGTVSLRKDSPTGALIGTSLAITSGSNTATFTFTSGSAPFDSAGAYTLYARYNGNTNVSAADSDTGFIVTVNPIATGAALTVVLAGGTSYEFTATLSPTSVGGGPTGTVTFEENTSGTTWVTRATMTISTGGPFAVTYARAAYTSGSSHTIRARYAGNTNYAAVTSNSQTVTAP